MTDKFRSFEVRFFFSKWSFRFQPFGRLNWQSESIYPAALLRRMVLSNVHHRLKLDAVKLDVCLESNIESGIAEHCTGGMKTIISAWRRRQTLIHNEG